MMPCASQDHAQQKRSYHVEKAEGYGVVSIKCKIIFHVSYYNKLARGSGCMNGVDMNFPFMS